MGVCPVGGLQMMENEEACLPPLARKCIIRQYEISSRYRLVLLPGVLLACTFDFHGRLPD